ncbi:hypothetical protein PVAND_015240 [Polypedilum vanderplanki]|uniref:Odorant receptor n=1 Tax=Polypedilum vanderplanki TaxID=319348 RepID=A0A9J6BC22_POLVA|nr:hypothetical protein PVAND_015240 [Polypedilum vanderplanki]
MFCTVVVQFSSMPFLHQLYGWFCSKNIKWEHVFALNLPFDTIQSSLIFWPFYCTELWIVFYNILIVGGTDMLYATLTHLTTMELNNLGQIMAEINWDDEDEEGELKAIEEIKKLAGIHQQLIEVTEELNDIFSPLMLVNVFGMLITLCIGAFLSVSGKGNYFLIKYLLSDTFVAWQLFIQCHYGVSLTDASMKVAEGVYNSAWYKASPKYRKYALLILVRAQRLKRSQDGNLLTSTWRHTIGASMKVAEGVYNSDWYKASPKYRKYALLVLVRAQKAQKITGWKFVDINLETYYWIIQTAHSYYSFLSGVYNP